MPEPADIGTSTIVHVKRTPISSKTSCFRRASRLATIDNPSGNGEPKGGNVSQKKTSLGYWVGMSDRHPELLAHSRLRHLGVFFRVFRRCEMDHGDLARSAE